MLLLQARLPFVHPNNDLLLSTLPGPFPALACVSCWEARLLLGIHLPLGTRSSLRGLVRFPRAIREPSLAFPPFTCENRGPSKASEGGIGSLWCLPPASPHQGSCQAFPQQPGSHLPSPGFQRAFKSNYTCDAIHTGTPGS